jgi:hypothetical protein
MITFFTNGFSPFARKDKIRPRALAGLTRHRWAAYTPLQV